ncbi:DUF305 domain-containing protein [Nonomuraea sp. NPDC050663]|uniref:DUF305 domain-containing protein n=1 Tax=Nonomuraea sp. NPDC050663 TaxID=3364370 RepID=UPI0037A79DE9
MRRQRASVSDVASSLFVRITRQAGRLTACLATVLVLCTACTGAPARPSVSVSVLSATDIAWAELMIPMNEQALRLMALIPDRTSGLELRKLADELVPAHRTELDRLRGLLAGRPTTNPHEGHEMPGMMTPAQLGEVETLKGRAFERAAVDGLRAHLEQSAKVCAGEVTAGAHPEAVELAAAMRKTRDNALRAALFSP